MPKNRQQDQCEDDDPIRTFVEELARYAARHEFRRLMKELDENARRSDSQEPPKRK